MNWSVGMYVYTVSLVVPGAPSRTTSRSIGPRRLRQSFPAINLQKLFIKHPSSIFAEHVEAETGKGAVRSTANLGRDLNALIERKDSDAVGPTAAHALVIFVPFLQVAFHTVALSGKDRLVATDGG